MASFRSRLGKFFRTGFRLDVFGLLYSALIPMTFVGMVM